MKNTFRNFITNRYTRREYLFILRSFQDKTFLNELEEQWDDIETEKITEFGQKLIWDKINNRIGLNSGEVKNLTRVLRFIQKAAAILFLPLLITSLFYYTQNNEVEKNAWAEIICPAGVRTKFQLPDGSSGFLNSKSKLKYPVNFENNRGVYLTGEAFFNVAKSKKSKFIVSTENLKVEVLGTNFNVMAYGDQSYEEITLNTGELKVLNKKNKVYSQLIPNQQFILDGERNQFTKKCVSALNYTSWISGKLIMQDERFEDVAKRLSRWYDVEIIIEDQNLKNYRYYATFEDESLNEVLRLMTITAPIQYKQETRLQNKDGSFTKQRIKIQFDEDRIKEFN